jgi:hypothetical protein
MTWVLCHLKWHKCTFNEYYAMRYCRKNNNKTNILRVILCILLKKVK